MSSMSDQVNIQWLTMMKTRIYKTVVNTVYTHGVVFFYLIWQWSIINDRTYYTLVLKK